MYLFTWNFWKAALVRGIRTAGEAAAVYIGSAKLLQQVNWWMVLSSAGMGFIVALLLAMATGLPEAEDQRGGLTK